MQKEAGMHAGLFLQKKLEDWLKQNKCALYFHTITEKHTILWIKSLKLNIHTFSFNKKNVAFISK